MNRTYRFVLQNAKEVAIFGSEQAYFQDDFEERLTRRRRGWSASGSAPLAETGFTYTIIKRGDREEWLLITSKERIQLGPNGELTTVGKRESRLESFEFEADLTEKLLERMEQAADCP